MQSEHEYALDNFILLVQHIKVTSKRAIFIRVILVIRGQHSISI